MKARTISTVAIIFSSIAIFLLFIYLLLHFYGSNIYMLYTSSGESDGLWYATNKVSNCVYVGDYNCTKSKDPYIITIPDTIDGRPVTHLGGYYGRGLPTPFMISLADLYMNAPDGSTYDIVHGSFSIDSIKDPYVVENIEFDLYIGKNIRHIEYIDMENYYPHINEDNSITLYHPVVRVHCSKDNKHFYSEDGKLYKRENHSLISDFEYATP